MVLLCPEYLITLTDAHNIFLVHIWKHQNQTLIAVIPKWWNYEGFSFSISTCLHFPKFSVMRMNLLKQPDLFSQLEFCMWR